MKADIRELRFDGANPFRADAKTDDSQGDVDQVGLAEGLNRCRKRPAVRSKLVMVMDDGLDLRPEMRESLCDKVISGQAFRRLQVVEGPIGPDTKVMKGSGNKQDLGSG